MGETTSSQPLSSTLDPCAVKHVSLGSDCVALIKPGIVRSNMMAAVMSYFIAVGSSGAWRWQVLVALMAGVALLVAGGCVLNNVYDRDVDQQMDRTKTRALASGRIQPAFALKYGVLLTVLGFVILWWGISFTVAILGMLGFSVYVGIYTMLLKRRSVSNTWVGGISGAMPPVMGAFAAANADWQMASLLFLLLFLWQPPHFFSLALRYLEDYQKSSFKMLPVVRGVQPTVFHLRAWIVVLALSSALPVMLEKADLIYLFSAILLGSGYLVLAFQPMKDRVVWSRRLFFYSLVYLLGMLTLWMIDRFVDLNFL